jgi:hypothetical protein
MSLGRHVPNRVTARARARTHILNEKIKILQYCSFLNRKISKYSQLYIVIKHPPSHHSVCTRCMPTQVYIFIISFPLEGFVVRYLCKTENQLEVLNHEAFQLLSIPALLRICENSPGTISDPSQLELSSYSDPR